MALLSVLLGSFVLPSVSFAVGPNDFGPGSGGRHTTAQKTIIDGKVHEITVDGEIKVDGKPLPPEPSDSCGWLNIVACIPEAFTFILSWMAYIFLTICSFILGIAGLLLKYVIEYTVVNMSDLVGKVGTINVAWRSLRDLANMFFIFIILYIAIATILNLEGTSTKKMIVNVVIIGLLINFSLFFTKIIIDGSNIITIGFYNNILTSTTNASTSSASSTKSWSEYGLASPFIDKMKVVGVYDQKALMDQKNNTTILLLGLGGGLIFLVAAFMFLAISFLFIGRFVILIFLMILSPVAFVSVALPQDKYSKMWWNKLLDQCIFAPVFMALLWVSLQIIDGILPEPKDGANFSQLLTGTNTVESIPLVMNFIIIIAMLLFCLITAKSLGAMGASTAMNVGKKVKNWGQGKVLGLGSMAGRQALRATGVSKLEGYMNKKGFNEGLLGRSVLGLTGLATKQKIGGKSIQDISGEKKAGQEAHAKLVDENVVKANAKKMKGDREVALPGVRADLARHTAEEIKNKTTKENAEDNLQRMVGSGTALSNLDLEKKKREMAALEADIRANPGSAQNTQNQTRVADMKTRIEITEKLKDDAVKAKAALEKSRINREIAESKIRDTETEAGPSTRAEITQLENMRKTRADQLENGRFAGKKTKKAVEHLRGKAGEKGNSKTGQLIAELERLS